MREKLRDIASFARTQESSIAKYTVYPIAIRLTWFFVRLGVTPNMVTGLSLICAVISSAAIAFVHGPWIGLGCIGVYVHYILDCTDGIVARYTGTASKRGALFDDIADRYASAMIDLAAGIAVARNGAPMHVGILLGLTYAWTEAVADIASRAFTFSSEDKGSKAFAVRLGKVLLEGDVRYLVFAVAIWLGRQITFFIAYTLMYQVSIIARLVLGVNREQ